MRYRTATLLVLLAVGGCGFNVVVGDPKSKCNVADRGKWRDSQLGESEVVQPYCPVVVTFHDYATTYQINVIANDLSKINPARIVRVSFVDINGNPIPPDITHKDLTYFFNGNVAQLSHYYLAAHLPNVTSGTDLSRIRVPLSTYSGGNADTARSEVFFFYKFHSQSLISGDDVGSTTMPVSVSADASAEFRPITYEWWIDGVHQGPPSSMGSMSHTFTTPGSHNMRVVVGAQDGHVYDLFKAIDITQCPNGEIIC